MHPLRTPCEQFIGARFEQAHGARIAHFSPYLLGVRDALDRWRAAAGYTPADGRRLFLEQYLDAPVERLLARYDVQRDVDRRSRQPRRNVRRHGARADPAARTPPASPRLRVGRLHRDARAAQRIRAHGAHAARTGRADPARLPDGGARWGRYYASDPIVVAGRIGHALRIGAR